MNTEGIERVPPSGKRRVSIIEAVQTPLGFFVLVVLIVEVIFALACNYYHQYQKEIVYSMIALIFFLILIVAGLACYRPGALFGLPRQEDPEITKIRENFREVEAVVDKVIGTWKFTNEYTPEGQQEKEQTTGFCEIRKGKYGIYINGTWYAADGKHGNWTAKQVFINDDGMIFIYELPRGLVEVILGVGQVRFMYDREGSVVSKMTGHWAVIGSKTYGQAEFERENSS
jgi:hypothetical protein